MRKKLLMPFILAICLNSYIINAQKIFLKHYSVNQGLPSSECYWIFQDSKRFLWICTDAGLVKYDGYNFKVYDTKKGLPENTVFKVKEDKLGRIWTSTISGKLAYYNYETDSIYTLPVNEELSKKVKQIILDFVFDDKNTIQLSSRNYGLYTIAPPYTKINHSESIDSTHYFLKDLGSNKVIYGTGAGEDKERVKFSASDKFFYYNLKFSEGKKLNQTNQVFATKVNRSYLFSASNYLFLINDREFIDLKFSTRFKDCYIVSTFIDKQGHCWVCTNNYGALVFEDYRCEKLLLTVLKDHLVSCVTQDVNGGYWITTTTNGIYYSPSLNHLYYHKEEGRTNNKVYALAMVNDLLYFTNGDLCCFNTKTKAITHFQNFKQENILSYQDVLYLESNTPTNQSIYSINSFTIANSDKTTILRNLIYYKKDSVFAYMQKNVFKVNLSAKKCIKIYEMPYKIFTLHSVNKKVIIGTSNGVFEYSEVGKNKLVNLDTNLTDRVQSITNRNDTLIIGTKGNGIFLYYKNKRLLHLTEKQGLVSDICKSIVLDKNNHIWIGTNKGISKLELVNATNYTIKNITTSNGLASNEVNQLLIHNNVLYAATNEGLATFNIINSFDKELSVPIYMQQFLVHATPQPLKSHYNLKYSQNYITVGFLGISLKNTENLIYKYKLEGLDTLWRYTKNTNVQFTTLPSGEYKFTVYATCFNKIISQPLVISFSIATPFYKTWWFYLLVILTLATCIICFFYYRTNKIKRAATERTALNKAIAELEIKALRAQMNPHFMSNCLASIQELIYAKQYQQAGLYIAKFSFFLRKVLDASEKSNITLQEELELIDLNIELEQLRFKNRFDYELIIEPSIDTSSIVLPALLTQPLIENAIWHGLLPLNEERKPKLKLTISQKETSVFIEIFDNGKGRNTNSKNEIKTGGIDLIKSKMDTINKLIEKHIYQLTILDLTDEDKNALGTKVILTINKLEV